MAPQRFRQLTKCMPVLVAIMEGKELRLADFVALTGLGEQQSKRLRAFLTKELGLESRWEGGETVVFRAGGAPVGAPDLMQVVAMEFASAGMEVFRDSAIHHRWEEVAGKAIAGASAKAQQIVSELDRALVYVRGPHTRVHEVEHALEESIDCLVNKERLRFSYQSMRSGEHTERVVEPWSVVVHEGILYLLAMEPAAGIVKLWRLDRVGSPERIPKSVYKYPNRHQYDPERQFRKTFGVWVQDLDVQRVELLIDGGFAHYVRTAQVHPTARCTERECGAVLLSMDVQLTPELERWILGLGANCVVVEPPELRKRVREAHRAAMEANREHPPHADGG